MQEFDKTPYNDPVWKVMNAIEPYFCPDTGNDEMCMQFDKMHELFNKSSEWNVTLARSCIDTYLQYTKPFDIQPSYLCYFMFQSHMQRYEEERELLDKLEEQHGFLSLYNNVQHVQDEYRNNPAFDADHYDPDSLEVLRIRGITITKKDIAFYEDETDATDEVKQFTDTFLDMLTKLGTSDNRLIAAETDDLTTQILDILSQYLHNQERVEFELRKHRASQNTFRA